MIPREVNVPESRIFKPWTFRPFGELYYDEAIQKALDGWFVDVGTMINDIDDERLESIAEDVYRDVILHTDRDTAHKLEVIVEPPVFPLCRRLFLTLRGTCDLPYRAGESTYRVVGIGKDGLEYERI